MKEGDAVNLEFDMIGKYILKTSGLSAKRGVTRDKLIESGW
jgi:riboflavin synthase alpha subunit